MATRTTFIQHVPAARWLWVLLVLLGGLLTPADAQTHDIITITSARVGAADAGGTFKTGAPSTEHPGVFVIDVGDMPAKPEKDADGNYLGLPVTITLSRPMGATAQRAATIKLGNMRFWGDGETVTFEPGETTKTVELSILADPSDQYPEESSRAVEYPVLEVGPFEVANPTEDAVRYIFYSRADLPEESANSLFGVYFEVDGLRPEFSNVSINKTAFKSGETMVITATMDNWQFVKRCQNGRFRSSFGVTLNDNESLEPGRYTFDEKTGQVTYYVTTPAVTETKTIYVDFGPACRIAEDGLLLEKSVQTSAERSFVVTVSPEAVTPNPITEFDIPGLPADGSLIVLKKTEEDLGMFILTHIDDKTFAIDPIYSPLDATNANQISYSVTNVGGANAAIINNGLDGISLNTGDNEGSFTFTASIGDEVKFSRTYTLMAKIGDEDDALAMPEPLNHSNKYYVGTVFPQFQFELKNPDNRPVDDAITVNYTHANGLTWTETYSLKALKSRESDRKSTIYDLPFSFTDEHPDVTDDENVPDWLELQANDYYYTANITLHPTPDQSISRYNFFTLAQRSYNADEVMLRELTSVANFLYVGAEGHIVYKIDGEDATGDLTLDNTEAIEQLLSTIESNGYYQDVVDESSQNDPRFKPLISPLHLPRAVFEVNDDFYEGANITLKCGEDVIQTINGYKGKFFFQSQHRPLPVCRAHRGGGSWLRTRAHHDVSVELRLQQQGEQGQATPPHHCATKVGRPAQQPGARDFQARRQSEGQQDGRGHQHGRPALHRQQCDAQLLADG